MHRKEPNRSVTLVWSDIKLVETITVYQCWGSSCPEESGTGRQTDFELQVQSLTTAWTTVLTQTNWTQDTLGLTQYNGTTRIQLSEPMPARAVRFRTSTGAEARGYFRLTELEVEGCTASEVWPRAPPSAPPSSPLPPSPPPPYPPPPVTCRFTVDDELSRVEIDDVDQTSSISGGDKSRWEHTKSITFATDAVRLRVCGYDLGSSPQNYAALAGFLMACDDGNASTDWGDIVSDTSSGWSAMTYSDNSFENATSSPGTPVISTSGFTCSGCGTSSTLRTPEKIWMGGSDAKYVCFTYSPPMPFPPPLPSPSSPPLPSPSSPPLPQPHAPPVTLPGLPPSPSQPAPQAPPQNTSPLVHAKCPILPLSLATDLNPTRTLTLTRPAVV